MDVRGKSVVVVGLGRSGVAAASLLLARGAHVVGVDAAPREKVAAATIALEGRGARLSLGGYDPAVFAAADLAVISPGVPSFPELEAFEKSGREVIGEMELASRFVSSTTTIDPSPTLPCGIFVKSIIAISESRCRNCPKPTTMS